MIPWPPTLSAAVEGPLDEAVLARLVSDLGGSLHRVYGRNGKSALLDRLPAFNHAAQHSAWLVLVDLDDDDVCAPPYRTRILPNPSRLMHLRVAVREVEAWLLADRIGLARFLSVPAARMPQLPELEPSPKRTIVALARRSGRRDIRQDLVPRPPSGRTAGPGYVPFLTEFVRSHWDPAAAELRSDSLRRCRVCIRSALQTP